MHQAAWIQRRDWRISPIASATMCASAISVGVMIAETSRRPTPLSTEVIEKLKPWHKRGVLVAPPYI